MGAPLEEVVAEGAEDGWRPLRGLVGDFVIVKSEEVEGGNGMGGGDEDKEDWG